MKLWNILFRIVPDVYFSIAGLYSDMQITFDSLYYPIKWAISSISKTESPILGLGSLTPGKYSDLIVDKSILQISGWELNYFKI
jgi:hypothetical protein